MTQNNQSIINQFFEAYGKRDWDALRQVVAEDVTWSFLGQHPFGGVRHGIDELIEFFDAMGGVMGSSKVKAEVLVSGANDDYVVEAQHITTDRADGHNLNTRLCVLWRFANGKIVEGTHLYADPQAADQFFSHVEV